MDNILNDSNSPRPNIVMMNGLEKEMSGNLKNQSITSIVSDLPVIEITGGGLSNEAIEAEKALLAADCQIYQRGDNLVRPVIEEVDASNGKRTKIAHLVRVDPPYLLYMLCQSAIWKVFNKTENQLRQVNPPLQVAKTILSRYGEWLFRPVLGVITTPTLKPDGTLLLNAGYDPITRYILIAPPAMPTIPELPTKEEATIAIRVLEELMTEFPFLNDADRSVALSAMITPVVRGAFDVAPMHVIKAHMPGSGKSFLVDVIAAIALGQRCPVMAAGRTEEETEKRLGAALSSGQSIISIDNVNGELGGDCLCQIIERPLLDIRILGKSEQTRIESKSTIFATGNNIYLIGDITRRVILCTLDAKIERPESRTFNYNPFEMVLANRGKYIAAILTIIRAYIVAGKPNLAPRLASFEGWSDIVRSALIWLGRTDPLLTMDIVRTEDPSMQIVANVFREMHQAFGSDRNTAAEIISNAGTSSQLYDSLIAVCDHPSQLNSRKLGMWFTRHSGRIINGLRLNSVNPGHSHAMKWYIIKV